MASPEEAIRALERADEKILALLGTGDVEVSNEAGVCVARFGAVFSRREA